jgi:cysteine desulfurase family protein
VRLARLVNAESPDRIALALNGTDALNIAIKGLGLEKGDHVVTTEIEHNSVNRPLGGLRRDRGVEVDKARANAAGIVEPDELKKHLRPNTRLIAATHCSNVIGAVAPIEEYGRLARDRGIPLLVDAAQTVGVERIDVRAMRVDLLAFPGHKNLFGPMGTGALYVREGVELDTFREGGTGLRSEVELHPETMPVRLEGGTPNAHGLAGLAAGLEFLDQEGVEKIRAHENRLALRFIAAVKDHPRVAVQSGKIPERQLGPVSLCVRDAAPQEIGAILDQRYAIACRTGLHCAPGTHRALGTFPDGTVRLSFGFFNTEADADAAARAVNEIATAL